MLDLAQPADRTRRVGRYLIGRRIGAGGMAVVDAAHQSVPGGGGRLVALKRMASALSTEESVRRLFFREASIATRIEHPNVVRTYDVGQEAGEAFIAMELLEGATLAELQRRSSGRLPLAFALRVVRDALRGLHGVHELRAIGGAPLGLVHQDVSPQNIHVAYEGTTRLLDFGVARIAAFDASRTDSVRGKPCYLAPEQLGRGSVDRRTDVFAMGIVLHELLTGARLFPRTSADAAYAAILAGRVPSARSLCPDVPEAVDVVAARALATDPADRFATADEMRLALTAAARDAGVREVDQTEVGAWVRELAPPAWTRAELEMELTGDAAELPTLPPKPLAENPVTGRGVSSTVRQDDSARGRRFASVLALGSAAVIALATLALRRPGTRAALTDSPPSTAARPAPIAPTPSTSAASAMAPGAPPAAAAPVPPTPVLPTASAAPPAKRRTAPPAKTKEGAAPPAAPVTLPVPSASASASPSPTKIDAYDHM